LRDRYLVFAEWIISDCLAAITKTSDGKMATTLATTVTAIKVDFPENEFS